MSVASGTGGMARCGEGVTFEVIIAKVRRIKIERDRVKFRECYLRKRNSAVV